MMHINNTAHRAVGGAVSEALRTSILLSFFVVGFLFAACEKDLTPSADPVHTQMQAFYTESTGLNETSADSVINYYLKFASFHGQHPECEADELFPPTTKNLGNAFDKYGIVQIGCVVFKTEWSGETHINF